MNYISYILAIILILVSQYILDLFIKIKQNQDLLLEKFSLSGNDNLENQEISIKNMFRQALDYSGVNMNNDEEGYDIDNNYDLLKKDLMKYADKSNAFYEAEGYSLDNSNTMEYNISINENANKPILKKEPSSYPRKQVETSIDKMYSNQNEKYLSNNNMKTLKPDLWQYENEKVMNGGELGEGLRPFDDLESGSFLLGSLDM
jgi:hypothetical protein